MTMLTYRRGQHTQTLGRGGNDRLPSLSTAVTLVAVVIVALALAISLLGERQFGKLTRHAKEGEDFN